MLKFQFFLTLVVFAFPAMPARAAAQPTTTAQPIVVELFTSEGCSSCPPADALLAQLSHQRTGHAAPLVLLGEHVEYWNGQGWNDRFSAPVFTQRQYDYVHYLHLATAYTPQIVIDGHLQTSGGNVPQLQKLLGEAGQTQKSYVVSLQPLPSDKLQISVSGPAGHKMQVLFAITEDNLTTSVHGGENQGRVLNHAAVVRELHSLGTTSDGHFEKTISDTPKRDWKQPDLRAIVLVQDQSTGEIQGAASIPFAGTSTTTGGQ